MLALKTAGLGTGVEATKGDLQAAEEEASRLLVKKEAAMDVETPQHRYPRKHKSCWSMRVMGACPRACWT